MNPKTPIELKMIRKFYDEYFSLKAYTKKIKLDKDNITAFAINYGLDNLDRNKNILALFVFEFWFFGYMIKKPSDERLLAFLKKFNIN